MSDEPQFVPLDDDSPEVQAAAATARAKLGVFRELLDLPNALDLNPCVKLRVAGGEFAADLWLLVVALDGPDFVARFIDLPAEFTGYAPDDALKVAEGDVLDWMVNDDGDLHGGYSLRLQRSLLPADEQAGYDGYIGVKRYV